MRTPSQNVTFAGSGGSDSEHPPGFGIAETLARELSKRGFEVVLIDNWRDCGWSIDLKVTGEQLQIALASAANQGKWILQIACMRKWFRPDRSEQVYAVAVAVQEILEMGGFTEQLWVIEGFPDKSNASVRPVRSCGSAAANK
jgi:hypothetical protein